MTDAGGVSEMTVIAIQLAAIRRVSGSPTQPVPRPPIRRGVRPSFRPATASNQGYPPWRRTKST